MGTRVVEWATAALVWGGGIAGASAAPRLDCQVPGVRGTDAPVVLVAVDGEVLAVGRGDEAGVLEAGVLEPGAACARLGVEVAFVIPAPRDFHDLLGGPLPIAPAPAFAPRPPSARPTHFGTPDFGGGGGEAPHEEPAPSPAREVGEEPAPSPAREIVEDEVLCSARPGAPGSPAGLLLGLAALLAARRRRS